jgi:magnesium chelatase accessory protein
MLLQQRDRSQAQLIGFNPAWLPLPGLPSLIFRPAAKLAALNPVSAWATAKLASKPAMIEKSIVQTGSHLDAEGLALYQSVFSHSGHVHSVLNMMAAWELETISQSLPQLQNKVSILVGMQDQTVPPSMAHEASRLMPQARVFEQSRLGHLAHEEDPAGTAQLILQL